MSDFRFPRAPQPSLVFGLLLACVALALILIGARGVSAIRGFNDEIAQKQAFISRAKAYEANGLPDQSTQGELYAEETPQAALAKFQTDLQQIAEDNGMQIEVIQTEPITPSGDLLGMVISVTGIVPESRLGSLLTDLATREPYILVNDVNLRRARRLRRGDGPRFIAIQMRLAGFAQR